ncbi:translocation/assembly module TamB domain-containing protein [Skermanella mucosa]|uniref:translocation/assembly module TamB domain-containing protein n=1 Tax=Skermanella mucosa TaxID=1789672 RepID=UPI00192B569B|nr:translocation/assembly module TamB domain-containing protein [Skermanella mucosa]UEM23153.1 translocation/assembly module TamB domain-containing protein [Skermanella mucosa]
MEGLVRRWSAALLLLGLVAGAPIAVTAQEESGQQDPGWITRQIQNLLSGPGRTVTIGRVSSSWSLDVTLYDLAIADDEGVWLQVDQAKLDWAAGALFRREFRISGLDVNRMDVERLPAGQPEEPPSDEPFSLPQIPDLPVGLDLRHLAVKELHLGAPVLGGEAATLGINGSARLGRGDAGLGADLDIERLDRPGGAKLALNYAPDTNMLDLDLTVEEPQGGVIARAADIPGLPPVNVALRGSGPLSGWEGRLDGNAGDVARIGAEATIRGVEVAEGAQGYGMVIRGDTAFARLLDPQAAVLVGETVGFSAESVIDPNRGVTLTPARVTLAAGTAELSGSYRFDPQELDFDYVLEAGADSALRTLAPDVAWQSVRLAGTAEGPVAAPTLTADLTAEAVDAAQAALDRAVLQLRAVPSGPLDQPGSTIDVTLNGTLTNPRSPSDPRIAQVAGQEVTIEGIAVVTPGAGEIRVADLRANTAAGTASATALVERWGDAVGAQVVLDVPDLGRLPDLPVAGAASVRTDLALEQGGQILRGEATAELRGLNSTDPALEPMLRDLAGDAVTLRLAADSQDAARTVEVTELALNAPVGSLTGTATVREFGQDIAGIVDLTVPELSRLSAVAGTPLAGAAQVRADLSGGNRETLVRADLTGGVTGLNTGTPAADALAGDKVDLAGLVTVGTDGSIDMPRLKIDGRNVALTAAAALRENRLDARWRADLPRLAVLKEPLATDIAGSTSLEGTATGPLDSLEVRADLDGRNLVLAGRNVPTADVDLRATRVPGAPRGTLVASAVVDGQPLDARTGFALEGQRLDLSDISLGAERNRIAGAIRVALDRLTASGRLAGDMRDLNVFSPLAGQKLGGSGRIEVRLDDPQGRQSATAAVQGRNILVAGPEGPLLAADRINLNADVNDALGALRFDAKLDGSGITAGGADLATLTASASGTPAKAEFQARTSGQAGAPAQPARVALAGGFSQEGNLQRLRLERLDGTYGGQPFRLVNPATATIGPDRYEVRDLLLASNEGRIALDAGLVRNAIEGSATLTQVPLALAELAAPGLGLDGQINGNASFAGTTADPRADLDLRVTNLTVEGGEAAGLSGIDISTTGRWRNGRLALDGNAVTRQRDGIDMRLAAELPLVLRQEPLTVEVPMNAPVSGALRGNVELATFNDLLATTGDRAQGRLDVNLDLGGSLGNPQLGGLATLDGARYENQAAGTVIRDIVMRLRGDGTRLTIDQFNGRTPNDGIVEASGSVNVDPTDPRAFDIRVGASNAQLVQIDLATVRLDTLLSLTGPLDNPLLQGPVTIERAEIQVPEQLPPSVVEIQVEEINRPGTADTPAPGPTEDAPSAFQLRLDLTVEAQNQIFVRGRGLNVELSSDVQVTGTAAEPIIGGGLRLVSGTLDLLTKRFEFQQANIDFVGDGSTDPVLDVAAQAQAEDITAVVAVTGRASNPKIQLTSTPELPQDEVIARVLFNKPFSDLSAIEAVQLAQSVGQLAGVGGGPGILDNLRNTLGVDRLELLSGEEGEGLEGAGVAAGRYVSRDVYVGAEQRVGEAGSRVVVEIDVTDNLKVRTDVGTTSGAGVGVLYEWEY